VISGAKQLDETHWPGSTGLLQTADAAVGCGLADVLAALDNVMRG
jgi:hypothetical protein